MKRFLRIAVLPLLLAIGQVDAGWHLHGSAAEELGCEICGQASAGPLPSQAALPMAAASADQRPLQPAASPASFPPFLKRCRAPPTAVS